MRQLKSTSGTSAGYDFASEQYDCFCLGGHHVTKGFRMTGILRLFVSRAVVLAIALAFSPGGLAVARDDTRPMPCMLPNLMKHRIKTSIVVKSCYGVYTIDQTVSSTTIDATLAVTASRLSSVPLMTAVCPQARTCFCIPNDKSALRWSAEHFDSFFE